MYQQKICYVDLYKNGFRCGNMGHVRTEWKDRSFRVQAYLCHLDRQTLATASLDGEKRIGLGNVEIIHGKGVYLSDWMPVRNDLEKLVFEASGGVYGICRLPDMKGEAEETAGKADDRAVSGDAVGKNGYNAAGDAVGKNGYEAASDAVGKNGYNDASDAAKGAAGNAHGNTDRRTAAEAIPGASGEKTIAAKVKYVQTNELQPVEPEQLRGQKMPMQEQPKEAVEPGQQTLPEKPVEKPTDQVKEQPEKEWINPVNVQNIIKRTELEQQIIPESVTRWHPQELHDTKWDQLSSMFPRIYPIEGDVEFLQIAPKDFVILRQEYQELNRNSFLLHGYYNYNHLILGKYPDKYYIGVPGIMHEQERLAAAMFGFIGFERGRLMGNGGQERQNAGNRGKEKDVFGYYMMEVGI